MSSSLAPFGTFQNPRISNLSRAMSSSFQLMPISKKKKKSCRVNVCMRRCWKCPLLQSQVSGFRTLSYTHFPSLPRFLFCSRDPVQNPVWSTHCWFLKHLTWLSLHTISSLSGPRAALNPNLTVQLKSLFFMSAWLHNFMIMIMFYKLPPGSQYNEHGSPASWQLSLSHLITTSDLIYLIRTHTHTHTHTEMWFVVWVLSTSSPSVQHIHAGCLPLPWVAWLPHCHNSSSNCWESHDLH